MAAPAAPISKRHTTSSVRLSALAPPSAKTMKLAIEIRKKRRTPRRVLIQPTHTTMAVAPRIKEVAIQAISTGVAANVPCMCGSAIAMVTTSTEYTELARMTVAMTRRRAPLGSGSTGITEWR